jgi:hypothetical protein
MARRSAPPPKPKTPILTVGQRRRRIERLQKCVTNLETFDPQKARKRAPAVLALEAAIDKALSSAFGYGTPAYLRYNEAATLDPSPLLAEVAVRGPARPIGGPVRTRRRSRKRADSFPRARSEQSLCSGARSVHSKTKSPVRSRWSPPARNHRRRRSSCRINNRGPL